MPLYTFIMEYAGGTYISQIKAPSPKSACLKWAKSIALSQISHIGEKGKESLFDQIEEETPAKLDGITNTWCITAHLRRGLVLINLVRTEITNKASG